jgi:arginine utilization protein RocB
MGSSPGEAARRWALAMTQQLSVTGTPGEVAFGPWLAARLAAAPSLASALVWTFAVGPGDGRQCVAMLLRGAGRRTVILTGHYDTVTTEDYGDLQSLATQPERLAHRLAARLARRAESVAEMRAKADLESGAFLPGRGLLHMKAGLAAALEVAERFAAHPQPGNLLFVAVPDEEGNSAGARAAARELGRIAAEHAIDLVAALNLDATADDDTGASGRIVALGTVGKLLPTAFVVGQAVHAGYPMAGINAATLASAIAMRLEWAEELTDGTASVPGIAPSLLSLRDNKNGYDVTIPASASATWNVLTLTRSPSEVMETFDRLCQEAANAALSALRERAALAGLAATACDAAGSVPVLRFAALMAELQARAPSSAALLTQASPVCRSSPESPA